MHGPCWVCLRRLACSHVVLANKPLPSTRVQIIAGKDKGTVGTIIKVVTRTGKVSVDGVNIRTKHISPRTENEVGQIKKSEYPIHHSNVMLYSKEQGVRSRVGYKVDKATGKKVWRKGGARACSVTGWHAELFQGHHLGVFCSGARMHLYLSTCYVECW